MGEFTEQQIRYADPTIVKKAVLHSFSIRLEVIGSGNPNVFRIYADAAFIRYGDKDESEQDIFIDNKMTSDRNDAEISRCVLAEFFQDNPPTEEEIINAVFSDSALKKFKLWKAQVIFDLSGEITMGYMVNEEGIIIRNTDPQPTEE